MTEQQLVTAAAMLRYLQDLVLHLQRVHPADGVLLWNKSDCGELRTIQENEA